MIIGITGSIATGKSFVSNYLTSKGYTVIDSDKIVHNLLSKEDVLKEISNVFGSLLIVNGKLDRKALGKIIFNNEEKRKFLNNIIHPKVIQKIREDTFGFKNNKKNLIFVDIPLLYEEHLEYLVDKIIVVYVPKNIQIERLMIRDNIDIDFALKKIAASLDIEEKKRKADYLVNNSFSYTNTYKEIDEILRRIKNEN